MYNCLPEDETASFETCRRKQILNINLENCAFLCFVWYTYNCITVNGAKKHKKIICVRPEPNTFFVLIVRPVFNKTGFNTWNLASTHVFTAVCLEIRVFWDVPCHGLIGCLDFKKKNNDLNLKGRNPLKYRTVDDWNWSQYVLSKRQDPTDQWHVMSLFSFIFKGLSVQMLRLLKLRPKGYLQTSGKKLNDVTPYLWKTGSSTPNLSSG
jgi:hypothetical protein